MLIMHTKQLTFLALALCLIVSCKKSSSSNSGGTSTANKLKTYIESDQSANGNLTDTFAVSYDNDSRIASLVSAELQFDYTYQSQSFTLDLYDLGQLSIHEVAYIGSNDYVDSTFQYDNTNDTTTEGYKYNGSQLLTLFTYNYSSYGTTVASRDDYTYDNGSVTKDVQTDGYGNLLSTDTYTYTTNPFNVTINPTYLPAQSKYLPATETVTDGSGNPVVAITFTYTFDSSGRLTKETDTGNDGEVATKTYVYE